MKNNKFIVSTLTLVIGGMLTKFLGFIIKVIGQGMARAARRGGYLIEFMVLCIIVILLGYFFTRKNN